MDSTPQPIGGFERAVNRFKSAVPKALSDQFARDTNTLSSLQDDIRSIQKEQGEGGSLRNMPRLSKFVEAMSQLGQVIEVFVNANDFVCFIWGPMKFLLGVRLTHRPYDTFDKLLNIYSQIGDTIPGLLEYKSTFEKRPTLMIVLHDYYSDILRFHELALKVFTRSKWKDLVSAVWKTFESSFGPIIQSLQSRRELLESEKLSASLSDIQTILHGINQIQQQQASIMNEEANEKHRLRIARIKEKLKAPDYFMDQEISTENRQGAETGQWITGNPIFQAWNDKMSHGHSVLYLNGIPGAGKTTLVSSIVERLLQSVNPSVNLASHSVAYFYYKHGNIDKNTHNASLRAILEQLIDQDTLSSQEFLREVLSQAEVNVRSTKSLEALTLRALAQRQLSFLVLDGLDECATGEAEATIRWLLSLIDEKLDSKSSRLRVIVSGQRNGVLDHMLSSQLSISLESSQHIDDMREYCRRQCARIKTKFNISSALEESIITRVIEAAKGKSLRSSLEHSLMYKGMFLYARVVLENLLHQTRLSGLKREIKADIFPAGINFAYERVVSRVIHDASQAEREDAKRVLCLIITAKRQLKWAEIQSFFCIDPGKGVVEYDDRLLLDAKQLCGSLVDRHSLADSDSKASCVIGIVHETARGYLIQRGIIQESLENARMLSFCARYLASSAFQITPKSTTIIRFATQGYYALLDYTVQYWYDHLEALAAANVAVGDISRDTVKQIKDFLARCTDRHDLKKVHFSVLDLQELLAKIPQDSHDRAAFLDMENRTCWIRQEIENLSGLTEDEKCITTELYGASVKYKCHKPWCSRFAEGFATFGERADHMKLHERPFACEFDGCFGSTLGFESDEALNKHYTKYHVENSPEIKFPKRNSKGRLIPLDLLFAAERGDMYHVAKYLDEGQDVNMTESASYKTPIWYAAYGGNCELCKLLLERGADPRPPTPWRGRSYQEGDYRRRPEVPLAKASAGGYLKVVEMLLESHAEADTAVASEIGSALWEAISKRDVAIVGMLVPRYNQHRPQIRRDGPLQHACRIADVSIVRLLLQNGLEIDADYDCVIECTSNDWKKPELAASARQILEMLLLTGRPRIENPSPIFDLISEHPIQDEAATMILSYSGTKLPDWELLRMRPYLWGRRDSKFLRLLQSVLGIGSGQVQDDVTEEGAEEGTDKTLVHPKGIERFPSKPSEPSTVTSAHTEDDIRRKMRVEFWNHQQ
ncbi:Ankyrin repeat and KH domain-containing protein 1 [Colletotrichum fructicola Nara gc5]|uniref:Ankyrin repeat and KH domain-containing protein 1 n=1 Tax=Colletotrichum fructicola (strain Nara gc5) TaxID=1213859 RepID=A0A7J6J3S1_COLFN|nr:Ankyrin repeat and KH domain-containing protein 1 [Colletotrichum fructicola Nara gc5]